MNYLFNLEYKSNINVYFYNRNSKLMKFVLLSKKNFFLTKKMSFIEWIRKEKTDIIEWIMTSDSILVNIFQLLIKKTPALCILKNKF